MRFRPVGVCFILMLVLATLVPLIDSRGGRRGGKGKGKSNLQFAQIADFSLVSTTLSDNRSAQIITGSYFTQTYRLGYKLLLICKAKGEPRPTIKWYKEATELMPKPSIHFYEKRLPNETIWSKLEIDPATMGDQGVYSCYANNPYGVMAKNFKAEYAF